MNKKIYKYEERVIVQFSDGTRANYSRGIYGDLLDKTVQLSYSLDKKICNYYEIDGENAYIYTWNRKLNKAYKIIIDSSDFNLICQYFWHINHNGYVVSEKNKTESVIYLHRLLMGVDRKDYDNGIIVDHIDRNPKNNKKNNLRVVTSKENSRNITVNKDRRSKTGFRGVNYCYDKNGQIISNSYRVRIGTGKDNYKEERYSSFEEAKQRRLELEKAYGYIREFND